MNSEINSEVKESACNGPGISYKWLGGLLSQNTVAWHCLINFTPVLREFGGNEQQVFKSDIENSNYRAEGERYFQG